MNKLYFINNKHYNEIELLGFAKSQALRTDIAQWEIDFYTFIIEWFSKKSTISINTSGSTGKPKLIELLKSDMILSAKRSIEYFKLSEGNNLLLCLSVNYIAGMMMVVRAFEGEMNLICSSPQQISKFNFQSNSIDFAALVPLQVEQLIHNKLINSINKIIIGGSQLPLNISENLSKLYNGKAWETYGMTETITHVAVCEINKQSERIFTALPYISLTVDKRDCLIITDELLHKNTIITNDRVELLSNKSFKLLGRADNVINSGGIKIQPEEIEQLLSPYIRNKISVIGIKDSKLGEKMILAIEKGEDKINLEKIISNLLPIYKQPKNIIELDRIPLNQNGKTDFKLLREMIESKPN